MFCVRSHVRSLISLSSPAVVRTLIRRPLSSTCLRSSSAKLEKSELRPSTPVAERLAATGIWKVSGGGVKGGGDETGTGTDGDADKAKPANSSAKKPRGKKTKITGDKARVNIVSEKLIDDVFSYLGPSLNRHVGCDIIDIYPGAGLWSRKLHEYLKPRSHILMEPDADLYRPFLEPILEKPGATLVPKPGIIWRDLNSILTPEYLPYQTPVEDTFQPSSRNDTLLVTANIAFHPRKKYRSFESLAFLVLHQFLDSIRSRRLFQKYGQVRMLIWGRYDDKGGILPKNMQRRKRTAIEGEMYCEWIHEVCGRDGPDSIWFLRDTGTDTYSTASVLKKMKKSRISVPEGRETEALLEVMTSSKKPRRVKAPGSEPPVFKRPFSESLSELEAAHESQVFTTDSEEYKTIKRYQWRTTTEEKRHQKMHELSSGLDAIAAAYKSGKATRGEIEKLGAEWHENMQACAKAFVQEFITYRDNLHYIRQDPPVLHWDRRAFEPLAVQPDEFYPNVECCLLDIQPKDVHPLIRQVGPRSNRAGDTLELIMSALMTQSTTPVSRILDALWPGAAEFIMPKWKSIHDLDHGGVPPVKSPYAEITPRMLNARQWEELMELWMQWPFRPEFHELIARTHDTDDPNNPDDWNVGSEF
ncbi:hypothetical protein DL768_009444 [Monosporascus sp. mg162]|nr:hypothetical protein DL768_009444 [Monosporascus sp. mg162]